MGEGGETGASTQGFMDLNEHFGRAAGRGNEVLATSAMVPAEMVAIDLEEGLVTYARRHDESYRTMEVTTGLKVVGVLRRQRVFGRHQLVECEAANVQRGDKLVLQTPAEEQITTKKLRTDWGANVRAQAARFMG